MKTRVQQGLPPDGVAVRPLGPSVDGLGDGGGEQANKPAGALVLRPGDFYFDRGLMVLTAAYHLRRGYCCGNGCRHCPYPDSHQ